LRRSGSADDGRRSRNVEVIATGAEAPQLTVLQQQLLRWERILTLINRARRRPLTGAVYYKWLGKRAGCDWRAARQLLKSSEDTLKLDQKQ